MKTVRETGPEDGLWIEAFPLDKATFRGVLKMRPKVSHMKSMKADRAGDQARRSALAQGVRQAFVYCGVSIAQTVVEFGVFALAQLALPTSVANGIAVACSGSFNFLVNRNVTFEAASNFWRSVAMFVVLYLWNFLFGTWFIAWAAATFGCPEAVGKIITMAMQGIWGFCLCKWVIFK